MCAQPLSLEVALRHHGKSEVTERNACGPSSSRRGEIRIMRCQSTGCGPDMEEARVREKHMPWPLLGFLSEAEKTA